MIIMFIIIAKSFVEATKFLLDCRPSKSTGFILSERFCQDPLESFFGNQRARGGRNDNPSVLQFIDNTVSLRLQRSLAGTSKRGNCQKRPREKIEIDDTPIPKRKKK